LWTLIPLSKDHPHQRHFHVKWLRFLRPGPFKVCSNDALREGELAGLIDKNIFEIYALSVKFLPYPIAFKGFLKGDILANLNGMRE